VLVKRVLLFVAWALLGAVFTYGLMYALLPAPLGLVWVGLPLLVAPFIPSIGGSRSPEIFGLLAGPGLYCFLGATSMSHPGRWIGVGLAFVASAALAYALAGRQSRIRHVARV
jgi:hypothetical protein